MDASKFRRIVLTLQVLNAASTDAQSRKPLDRPLTKSEVQAILTNAADKVEKLYVIPEAGRRMGAALRRAISDTAITGTVSSLALVPKVNRILTSTHRDAHLAFGYSFEVQTERADSLVTDAELEALRISSENGGHGVKKVDRMAGGIGYIQLTAFRDPAFGAENIAAAMRLVKGTRALIIDLRDSQGGAPEMVTFLASYFFKEPTLLSEVYLRPQDLHKQSWTEQWIPGGIYDGPVYVLTNNVTRSAAEGFTYSLQARKRVTVVGAVTRGAAHMGKWEIVSPHFAVYVPIGKVTETITKRDWEQTGVKPDVVTAPEAALLTAHRLALQKLIATTTDKEDLETLNQALEQLKQ